MTFWYDNLNRFLWLKYHSKALGLTKKNLAIFFQYNISKSRNEFLCGNAKFWASWFDSSSLLFSLKVQENDSGIYHSLQFPNRAQYLTYESTHDCCISSMHSFCLSGRFGIMLFHQFSNFQSRKGLIFDVFAHQVDCIGFQLYLLIFKYNVLILYSIRC